MMAKGVVRDLLNHMLVVSHAVRRRIGHIVVLASCVGTFAACDEAVTGVVLPPTGGGQLIAVTPTQLVTQFGDFFGGIPIRVRVVDANGNPVPSATVHYNVLVGSGFFSADSTITSDQGFTEVTFTPTSAGTVVIEARFEGPTGTQRVQFTIFVFNDPSVATRFEKVSGDNQAAEVGAVLPSPFVVRLLNADGFPVANVPVTFAVGISQGVNAAVSTSPSGPFAGQVVVLSDSSGFAQVFARLGTEAGPHTFTARAAVGPEGLQVTQTLTFNAQANASGRVALLVPISGFDQTAVIDTLHERSDTVNFRGRDPQPLVLQAQDRFGNPVANAVISWFVSDGGGTLQFATTVTNSQGVSVNRILDVTEGRNVVVAFASGADPIEFVIEAEVFVPQEEEPPPPPEEP
jgi:hypothetical protein